MNASKDLNFKLKQLKQELLAQFEREFRDLEVLVESQQREIKELKQEINYLKSQRSGFNIKDTPTRAAGNANASVEEKTFVTPTRRPFHANSVYQGDEHARSTRKSAFSPATSQSPESISKISPRKSAFYSPRDDSPPFRRRGTRQDEDDGQNNNQQKSDVEPQFASQSRTNFNHSTNDFPDDNKENGNNHDENEDSISIVRSTSSGSRELPAQNQSQSLPSQRQKRPAASNTLPYSSLNTSRHSNVTDDESPIRGGGTGRRETRSNSRPTCVQSSDDEVESYGKHNRSDSYQQQGNRSAQQQGKGSHQQSSQISLDESPPRRKSSFKPNQESRNMHNSDNDDHEEIGIKARRGTQTSSYQMSTSSLASGRGGQKSTTSFNDDIFDDEIDHNSRGRPQQSQRKARTSPPASFDTNGKHANTSFEEVSSPLSSSQLSHHSLNKGSGVTASRKLPSYSGSGSGGLRSFYGKEESNSDISNNNSNNPNNANQGASGGRKGHGRNPVPQQPLSPPPSSSSSSFGRNGGGGTNDDHAGNSTGGSSGYSAGQYDLTGIKFYEYVPRVESLKGLPIKNGKANGEKCQILLRGGINNNLIDKTFASKCPVKTLERDVEYDCGFAQMGRTSHVWVLDIELDGRRFTERFYPVSYAPCPLVIGKNAISKHEISKSCP